MAGDSQVDENDRVIADIRRAVAAEVESIHEALERLRVVFEENPTEAPVEET